MKQTNILEEFKTFVNCTHGDIDHDDYGCNTCKLCKSSSSDRCDLTEVIEKLREGVSIDRLKQYKFSFNYDEYTTAQYNYIRKERV